MLHYAAIIIYLYTYGTNTATYVDAYWPSRQTLKCEMIPILIDRDRKTTWKEAPDLLNETLRVVSDKTMNVRIKMKDGVYYRTLLIGSALLGNSSGSELASWPGFHWTRNLDAL